MRFSDNEKTLKIFSRKNFTPYNESAARIRPGGVHHQERVNAMNKETWEEISERMSEEVLRLRPEELPAFLKANRAEMLTTERPFTGYMRFKLREKGLLQQNVFLGADLSENYGYKLISGEKRTRRRDTVLRLCLGARFSPEETRCALILYGMAPLYVRFPRDAVLLWALGNGVWDLRDVNALLTRCGQAPLVKGYE